MNLNQELLEKQILDLENGLVTSHIELIKIPVFNDLIEKELEHSEQKEELEKILDNNKKQYKAHKESIVNLEKILNQVYLLRK